MKTRIPLRDTGDGQSIEHVETDRFVAPAVRTNAIIADAVEKAIRSIDISERLRIKRIDVTPEYSISDDERLIAAEVSVKFSMIFPRRTDE